MEESQSHPAPSPESYFDPEELDTSEQQFSASLETTLERPQFVLDSENEAALLPADAATPAEILPAATDFPQENRAATPSAMPEAAPPQSIQDGDWRDQVSMKVNSYKARRPQKDRYPSLRLPFDPEPRDRRAASFAAEFSSSLDQAAISEKPVPEHYQPIVLESVARVLEFPRFAPPPRSDELAEPVADRPRIVEAPELVPPPPALGGILIEPAHQPEPERRPGIDFPLQSASISRRILAALADSVIISTALAAFGYIFLRINGVAPPPRIAAEIAAILLAILWMSYHYAFLVFTGSTPGLRLSRLQVSRFNGNSVGRSLRRWRVLASCLSCFSLGLGYAWCLLDEDQLCWHDRITKTHLARR